MKLNFSTDAFMLPASVLTHAKEVDAAYLRVLLHVAADLALAQDPKALAKHASCDVKTTKAALQFWLSCGVLTAAQGDKETARPAASTSHAPVAPGGVLRRADTLPQYTSTELAELLEKRTSMRVLVDEAQRILGKMFHPAEINLLVGMTDYLEMSEECILLLLAHCKRMGKTNMRSIEKYACDLADKGIVEASAMEEELRTVEELHSFEGEIRTLFGLKARSLSAKEKKMLRAWIGYGYGIDVVRMAYEITVNATGDASLPYANSILERWHSEGLQTAEQIEQARAEDLAAKEKSSAQGTLGNSFDTDDFFEAALRRGLSEHHGT